MKLATYTLSSGAECRLGVVLGNDILDLNAATDGLVPTRMRDFLEQGEKIWAAARKALEAPKASALKSLRDVRLKAPLSDPPSLKDFFAFESHARAGAERRGEPFPEAWYEIPAYYKGNHREIYGPEDEIPWPSYTRKLDFECEIACVIGKKGRNLSPEEAAEHIFGYMIFNDFSARDIQKKERALGMGPAKGKDFANSFGPYLVTADEADPRRDFTMTAKINGETWSEGRFKDQYWGFPLMISHVSQEETVYPGDILGSGTFYKGCGMDLERWVNPGDIVELEVPGLGKLRNKIGAPRAQKRLDYRDYVHHTQAR